MSDQPQPRETWECPYCHFLTDQPWDGSTHYDVCPFSTNWWTVGEDEPGPVCGICRKRLKDGNTYRYIPLYREPDPEVAEEVLGNRLAQLFELVEVCALCSSLRVVA